MLPCALFSHFFLAACPVRYTAYNYQFYSSLSPYSISNPLFLHLRGYDGWGGGGGQGGRKSKLARI